MKLESYGAADKLQAGLDAIYAERDALGLDNATLEIRPSKQSLLGRDCSLLKPEAVGFIF